MELNKIEKLEESGMSKSYWIWYPGDFELYHGMKQNFSRVERGFGWPAFWKSEGFRNRVAFRRTYHLEEETSFAVWLHAHSKFEYNKSTMLASFSANQLNGINLGV